MAVSVRDILLNLRTKYDGKPMARAAEDLGRVDDKASKAGKSMRGMSDDASALRLEIDRTNQRVIDFNRQIARTGDLSLFGDLRREERRARDLGRVLTAIMPDVGDESGEAFTRGFARSSVSGLPTRLRGALILGIAGVAPVVAPILGAAVAGAVTGAVGLGGIAGGIFAAGKDDRVRRAAHQFGQDIATEFFSGGQVFVQPTVDSLGILKDAFHDLELGQSWAKVAPHVTTVARGIGDMARDFMPGFNKALDKAGPTLDAMAVTLPRVGEAVGDFFGELAASEGAASGMVYTLNLISSTILVTGRAIAWLGNRFHDGLQAFAAFAGVMEDVPIFPKSVREGWASFNDDAERVLHTAQGLDHAFSELPGAMSPNEIVFGNVSEEARGLADAMADVNSEISAFFRQGMDIPTTADAIEAAIDDFTAAMKANGVTFDANTEKGRENRDAIRDMIRSAQEHRAALAADASTAAIANTVYDEQIARIEALARKYGLTRLELEKIAGDYTINVITTFITRGRFALPSGDFRVAGGGRLLAGEGTIRLTATPVPNLNPPPAIPRQHGGPVEPGRTYKVGESGTELLTMGSQRGHVTPSHALREWDGGLDYARLARALASAVEGMMVTLDGMTVGRVIDGRIALHDRDVARRVR